MASDARWLAGTARWRCGAGRVAQLLDLVAYVGLGVEPRPGDFRLSGRRSSKVTGVPARSSSRSARMALARVSSCRRRARRSARAVLSAGIGGCSSAVRCRPERGDDRCRGCQDLLVHLGEAGLAAGLGGGDDLQDLLPVIVVLGQELGVVMNIGQVRHALACGQVFCTGSRSSRWAAPGWPGASRCLAQAASAERPVRVELTGCPAMSDLAGLLPVLGGRWCRDSRA